MLCPNCKNEKWNDETCPHCGMDHPAAILAQADHYHRDGLNIQAARQYEEYLRLDPDRWEVSRKRAIAWYGETVSTKNKSLFDKADQALAQTLDQDWDWEQGHQFRVNLYYAFGRLEEMTQEYSKTLAEVPERAIMAAKVLKV
ncbi:MAG: tetratricopeptide repeat protein, partial [bacterium]